MAAVRGCKVTYRYGSSAVVQGHSALTNAMSEYQYYEFLAQDRPLTPAEQQELRAISTRARISSNSFQNEYSWGDLKANPSDLVRQYFDLHIYLANWGDRRLLMRLPKDVFAAEEIGLWVGDYGLEIKEESPWTLVELYVTEQYDAWVEGEGWMAQLAPIRQRLLRGDRRPLYIAWLADALHGESHWEDEALEPPVPKGLQNLPPDCVALGEFLCLDPDLLAAAAIASPPLDAAGEGESAAAWHAWLDRQPQASRDAWLLQFVRDVDAGALRAKLLQQFLKETRAPEEPTTAKRRYLGELRQLAEDVRAERIQKERQQEAERRARKQAKQTAERERRLKIWQGKEQDAWAMVETHVARKNDRDYQQAAQLVGDLQELAKRQQQLAEFESALNACVERHRRKRNFIRSLKREGLQV